MTMTTCWYGVPTASQKAPIQRAPKQILHCNRSMLVRQLQQSNHHVVFQPKCNSEWLPCWDSVPAPVRGSVVVDKPVVSAFQYIIDVRDRYTGTS